MIELGLKFTISYLLGSVLGSLIVGQLRGGIDIRQLGSQNPGGTNALRTQGKWFALWVMVIDVGKGALCVAVLPMLVIPGLPTGPDIGRELVTYAVGAAVVIGHVYPLWYDFRGGKGGATAIGVLSVLAPTLALGVIVIWLGVIAISGYVGLATMAAASGAAAYIGVMGQEPGLFAFATSIAAFIVFTHRTNIRRMRDGTEVRMGLLRFGK